MTLEEILVLIYFVVGFFVMALPVFDPKMAKSFDKLDTPSFLFGCMIIWVAWPLLIWVALRSAQDAVNKRKDI